jgi:hypothetical protein
VLSEDHSCRDTVSRIIAHRAANDLPICSPNTASYCAARSRLPRSVLRTLATRTAEELQKSIADDWKWNGRSVFILDGSHVSMPDPVTSVHQQATRSCSPTRRKLRESCGKRKNIYRIRKRGPR